MWAKAGEQRAGRFPLWMGLSGINFLTLGMNVAGELATSSRNIRAIATSFPVRKILVFQTTENTQSAMNCRSMKTAKRRVRT